MRNATTVTALDVAPVSAPLSAAEFSSALSSFAPFTSQGVAVAVSGGPDSMALALCIKQWATTQNIPVCAFIVDHALRSSSADEAIITQKQLQKLGIPTEILRWEHGPITTKLHATARKARYALLCDACCKNNIRDLMLAHQQEDQAETILMRLAKGSGIDGLAGIAPETTQKNIRMLRPLLGFAKQRLIATCNTAQISFVTDPSNQSDKFARGRLRRVMPLLTNEGMTLERLCDLGTRANEARSALNHYMNLFMQTSVQRNDAGVIHIDLLAFKTLPRAIAERVITSTLQNIHREDYAPEHASLSGLLNALCDASEMKARTLHGCLVSRTETQSIFMREYAAITDALVIQPGETVLWDGRWQVTLSPEANTAYTIRPLGNPPHDVLDRLAPSLRRHVLQGRARASLPALWTGEKTSKILALIPALTRSSTGNQSYAQLVEPATTGQ